MILTRLFEPVGPGIEVGTRLDTTLADLVAAWNVLRHVYPYLPEVEQSSGIDWDRQLLVHLRAALATPSGPRAEAISRLVADAHDGHGQVVDRSRPRPTGRLPVHLQRVEGQVEVAASRTSDLPAGSIVTMVDGEDVAARVTARMRLASGSAHWREWQAIRDLVRCDVGASRMMTVAASSSAREHRLTCAADGPLTEERPAAVTEIRPGLWYVDLTRARWIEVEPVLPVLATARGVVFDVDCGTARRPGRAPRTRAGLMLRP